MNVKTIFMGTPEFAAGILAQLGEEPSIELIGIVSQPDKPVGRKKELQPTPAKAWGIARGIPVLQPVKIRREYAEVVAMNPDLIITCAYGQIIPDEILAAPRLGAFNLHGSLLPHFRGGAPIQRAIMAGAVKTGMTLMEMAAKMDAGDIIAQKSVDIPLEYTYGDLSLDLMHCGCELLHENLPSLIAGNYRHTAQDESQVTFAWNIKPEEEKISFREGYLNTYNHVRALLPAPGAYALIADHKLKFYGPETTEMTTSEPDGELLPFVGGKLCVACSGRVLAFREVQPEGKKKMPAADFRNGQGRALIGRRFY